MIEIYYSGAESNDSEQKDPNLSIGGLVSKTLIPNDQIGNLFNGLPDQNEYVVLFIKNETAATIPTLELYFDYPLNAELEPINKVKYFIGGAIPTVDSCGEIKTEKLSSRTSAPYTIQFTEATTDNRFTVTNLDVSDYFAIFVKRELIPDTRTQTEINQALYDQFKANETDPTKETIQLVFSY